MAKTKKQIRQKYSFLFYKEVIFSFLAVLSLVLLGYEFFYSPPEEIVQKITKFDFLVALLFLTDFLIQLYRSNDKKKFMKHNWYLLLASIPLVDSWTEVLRGLRILSLVRLVRASEHIKYAADGIVKPKKH